MALALGVGASIALLLGVLCFPGAVTNPEATGSFFVVARASDWFLADSRNLFVIGGLLALCSIGLWLTVRTAFRLPRE
jgi:phosphate/sulfate permease